MKMTRIRIAFFLAVFFIVKNLAAQNAISLAGEWRFALDPANNGAGENQFQKNLPDKIHLPGILEAQGYGDEISIGTPWVLSLYDHFWYLRADYEAYTNAGNVKVPFISQPPRHYIGCAWYQRDIDVPQDWYGKRLVLFLERPHWKTTVWLDNKEIGSDISLCTPHEYDFGIVPPGKHRLTICVDNRMILPYRLDAHSVSDSLDDAWNGIVGKIELRATPPVWIDNVQVFPNLKNKSALVKVWIGNITGKTGTGTLSLGCAPGNPDDTERDQSIRMTPEKITWGSNGSSVQFSIPVADYNRIWDEFHPSEQYVAAELKADQIDDLRQVYFGFRDFHAQGNQFILNGHPIYFRGTHFGGDFPLTGYPPTDVASWKKIFQTCKSYGLNHMRFHSWCPPEAAFEAADELGFYLQIECGMWNSFAPGDRKSVV